MTSVVFIHPDLGIGGAERAMVDAALALKSRGKRCEFYTAHHDKTHCFTETRDGTFPVTVAGDFFPRSVFGYFHAMFAYIRMIYVTLYWVVIGCSADIVICDQISVCIPFLKWFSEAEILFYCHFPDKLLAKRNSGLRRLYRLPFDWMEEYTTGMADRVVVNSKFTAGIFKEHFPTLSHTSPEVVYPVPDFSPFDKDADPLPTDLQLRGPIFLSLNRYERKKNIGLAIRAMALLLSKLPEEDERSPPHLIIAGGYDERVAENVEHFLELVELARQLQLEARVTFLRSVSDNLKHSLLKESYCLLYTPENEHFGIVPVEAMYCKLPVIAVNSGGPLETIIDSKTGYLCQPNAEAFSVKMKNLVQDKRLRTDLGEAGHVRMIRFFSFQTYTEKLNRLVDEMTVGV